LPLILFYVCQQRRRCRAYPARRQAEPPSSDTRKRILMKHSQVNALCAEIRERENHAVTIADIMTPQVSTIGDHATVQEVDRQMRDQRTRHLVVVDASEQPIGVISDRDLHSGANTAREMMARHPVTVSSSSTIGNAVALMLSHRISSLPVIDEDQRLRGIVTTTDMLLVLQCFIDYYERARTPTQRPLCSEEEMLQSMLA
ncbi:MAG: CBS domain-containing protein, partial [Pirellulaceae bacterium]